MALTRKTLAAGLVAIAGVSLAGCSASASTPPSASSHASMTSGMAMPQASPKARAAEMTPGMVMPDGSTMAPGSPGTAPSEAAKMICTGETRDNISTVLSVEPEPNPASTWRGGTYTCTYRLPAGTLVLSVHESADVAAAAVYTKALRPGLTGAKDLAGLTDLAFGTTNGVVVMQKDNDTLRVDTSRIARPSDRLHQKRADFAYDIAAVVLGCWTGD